MKMRREREGGRASEENIAAAAAVTAVFPHTCARETSGPVYPCADSTYSKVLFGLVISFRLAEWGTDSGDHPSSKNAAAACSCQL